MLVIDVDHQGELDCPLSLHSGGQKDHVWTAGDPLGLLLVLPGHGKLQQPNPGRVTEGTDPSGMAIWSLLQEKRKDPLSC